MKMQHDAPPPASMDVDTVTRVPKASPKPPSKKALEEHAQIFYTGIPMAPAKPRVSDDDILALVGIAERLYHLPGGKNGNGVVGQLCARVRATMKK